MRQCDDNQNSQTHFTSTPTPTLSLHPSLPPPPFDGHRHVIRFHREPIKHPGRVDRHRRYGQVHVHPPPQSRLHPHRLQPHPPQGPTPRRPWGSPGPLPQRRHLQSDVVFSIVGHPSDVRSVLLEPSTGTLSSLRPGGVLVDMTTSEPSLAVEVSSAAAAKPCFSVDAPVTGGDIGAKNGTLAILAGGEEDVVVMLTPLFARMGKVNYMGGSGKGQFAKLANQTVIASTMAGLVKGMVFAHKAGVDVGLFLNAIKVGAAGSKSLDLYGGRILGRDFEPGFYVNHFVKDLGICLKECQNMGLALPGLALAQQLYLSLKAHGEGNLGTQALIVALERLNNVSLESAPAK